MKKILTVPIVIVFLITILVTGGCKSAGDTDQPKGLEEVTIYLQAHEIDEEMHLKMYDSNDTTIVVVDTLHTYVQDSTLVIWTLADDSGIRKIKKISPKEGKGKIIPGDATGFLSPKKKKLKIPDNQKPDTEEGYYIIFRDTNGKKHKIDPYLKIPRQ